MLIGAILGRLKGILIMGAILATVLYAGYYYYNDTQQRLQTYAENQAKLETALEQQINTTRTLLTDIERLQETARVLNEEFADSRTRVADLERTFRETSGGRERDIGETAAAKPGLVQNIVNTATQDVFRCLELLSGSQATSGELADETVKDCITDNNSN